MKRDMCLDAAKECVCKNREEQYGSPENNFQNIANLWNLYLKTSVWNDPNAGTLTSQDVGMMMALMKIARLEGGNFKEDSFVDACGYLACACELATEGGLVHE